MSEAKHTPGPWVFLPEAGRIENITTRVVAYLAASPSGLPGLSSRADSQMKQARANGRLIAAAPELIEALEALGALPEGYCFCYGGKRDANKPESEHFGECREARAAIRKARGD
jgi:hypothetical protein